MKYFFLIKNISKFAFLTAQNICFFNFSSLKYMHNFMLIFPHLVLFFLTPFFQGINKFSKSHLQNLHILTHEIFFFLIKNISNFEKHQNLFMKICPGMWVRKNKGVRKNLHEILNYLDQKNIFHASKYVSFFRVGGCDEEIFLIKKYCKYQNLFLKICPDKRGEKKIRKLRKMSITLCG